MIMQTSASVILSAALALVMAGAPHIAPQDSLHETAVNPADTPTATMPDVHAAKLSNGYSPEYVALDHLTVLDDMAAPPAEMDQPFCAARQDMGARLATEFLEQPVTAMETRDGLAMELWVSSTQGTWTALHHGDDGISCIVASGFDWSGVVDGEQLLRMATVDAAQHM